MSLPFLGEFFCLAAALGWAFSLSLFQPIIARHGAWAVNFGKNILALGLLVLTLVFVGGMGQLLAVPLGAAAVVAGSGLLGLSVGDTALFGAVGRIGVYRTLLLQTFGPVFAALLSWGLYGEVLNRGQALGGVVILAGIALALRPSEEERGVPLDWVGVVLALVGTCSQGAGVVLAKSGMEDVAFLPASCLRLAGGVLGLLPLLLLVRRVGHTRRLLGTRSGLGALAWPTFLGTYLTIMAMMAGIAMTPAAVAAVLLATNPIFSLLIEARRDGSRIQPLEVVGTLLAVAGVGWVSAGG